MALDSRLQLISDCVECGTKFQHIASRANKAKYCSPTCYHKAMSRKGTMEYSCFHCQIKFLSAPSKNRKYCSRACVNKSAKETFAPKFTTVRKAMVKRNMLKKCENCGFDTYPQLLGVHHKDRNRNNNNLENLAVLCPNCHSIEHMKHISH
jgi:Zn finger protein HypA/HybF involved in hydrogenase expression